MLKFLWAFMWTILGHMMDIRRDDFLFILR